MLDRHVRRNSKRHFRLFLKQLRHNLISASSHILCDVFRHQNGEERVACVCVEPWASTVNLLHPLVQETLKQLTHTFKSELKRSQTSFLETPSVHRWIHKARNAKPIASGLSLAKVV